MKKLLAALVGFLPALAFAQSFGVFQPGGDLAGAGSTWNNQVIAPGAVTLAKQATVVGNVSGTPTPAIIGNNTSTAATPAALAPLQVANVLSAVLSVNNVCIGTCLTAFSGVTITGTTLPSGLTTAVDGTTLSAGQTVLITGYTTNAYLNGIYIAGTGTWTRAVNFIGSIAANCDVAVIVRNGTTYQGHMFKLGTGSAITIGTTAQVWSDAPIASATNTTFGTVKVSATGNTTVASTGGVAAVNDCVSFGDTNGSITDYGDALDTTGPCIVGDAHGHVVFDVGPPSVSGSGCSLTSGGRDSTGSVVATGADTCTVTFSGAFAIAPNCTATGVGATVIPYLNALPTTTAAVFKTTAAGTFTYHCL